VVGELRVLRGRGVERVKGVWGVVGLT